MSVILVFFDRYCSGGLSGGIADWSSEDSSGDGRSAGPDHAEG